MNRALLVALVLCCASCSTNPSGTARSVLRIRVHDRPPDDLSITAVLVTVDRLGLREEGGGWTEIPVVPRTVDLMLLTGGVSTLLAQQPIGAATYTELRLGLREAHLVRDGVDVPLDVPSGTTSGIKVKGNLTVVPDALVELSLDFDPGRSIHVTGQGKYVLNPVIEVDGQTVVPGAATALHLAASAGGRLTLPGGVVLDVPPGAMPADGTLSIVEDVTSDIGGTLVGRAYDFYPSGLQFLSPVAITLPYDPALVPPGTSESSLFLTEDWAVVDGSVVHAAEHTITAQATHFSRWQPSAPEPCTTPHEGVRLCKGGTASDPYVVVITDSWSSAIRIRGTEAPTVLPLAPPSTPGGLGWSDGNQFYLSTLLEQTEGNAIAAINTVAYGPEGDYCSYNRHTYANTMCNNGTWRRFGSTASFGYAENRVAIPEYPFSQSKILVSPSLSPASTSAHSNVIGSTTTIAWGGGFRSSKPDAGPYETSSPCLDPPYFTCIEQGTGDCELDSFQPRTAVGTDESGRYLFMYANGGERQGLRCSWNPRRAGKSLLDVYNILRNPRTFGSIVVRVQNAVHLDSGHSSTLQSYGATLVKPNDNLIEGKGCNMVWVPAEGFPTISGLEVVAAPHVASVSVSPLQLNQPATGTIVGTNLLKTTAWFMADCVGDNTLTSGNSTERTFTCVPSYTAGDKVLLIKDRPGGQLLYDGGVTVF
jgi:uncharacterized protein DUF4382